MGKNKGNKTVIVEKVVASTQAAKKNKRKRNKKKNKNRGMGMSDTHAAIHDVCAISNPFCSSAAGEKLPDMDTTKSLTFCSRNLITVTTDSSGRAAVACSMNPTNAYSIAATFTGATTSVASWGSWQYNRFYAMANASWGRWRVVSAGSRFVCTAAWTAATGTMTINETNWFTTSILVDIAGVDLGIRGNAHAIRDANYASIMRPMGTNSYDYQDGTSTATTHTSMIYGFNGAPASTTLGYIELVVNYEWVPLLGSTLTMYTTDSPRDNYGVRAARADALQSVSLSLPGDKVDETFLEHVARVVTGGAQTITSNYNSAKAIYNAAQQIAPVVRAVGKAAPLLLTMG